MQDKPEVRHCPVCGTAMVSETAPSIPEARPRFACLNCGAVIVLSRHRDDDSPKPE
jgi:ribosomal protein S27AE